MCSLLWRIAQIELLHSTNGFKHNFVIGEKTNCEKGEKTNYETKVFFLN